MKVFHFIGFSYPQLINIFLISTALIILYKKKTKIAIWMLIIGLAIELLSNIDSLSFLYVLIKDFFTIWRVDSYYWLAFFKNFSFGFISIVLILGAIVFIKKGRNNIGILLLCILILLRVILQWDSWLMLILFIKELIVG